MNNINFDMENILTYNELTERFTDGNLVDDSYMAPVKQMLKAMSGFSAKYQAELAALKLSLIRPIECVSLNSLFDAETVRDIKRYVRPAEKNCFADAFRTADLLGQDGVEYCEGYMIVYGIPIEHAFNSYNGSFFDVTREIGGNDDVTKNQYVFLKSWDAESAMRIMSSDALQTYGNVFDKEFLLGHKNLVEPKLKA